MINKHAQNCGGERCLMFLETILFFVNIWLRVLRVGFGYNKPAGHLKFLCALIYLFARVRDVVC